MIAIHELEELCIGDVTPLNDVDKKSLESRAKKGVLSIVKNLHKKDELLCLTEDFNSCSSAEAKFAKGVDKLECVLEFKKYQDLNQVSLSNLTTNMLKNKFVKSAVEQCKYDLADIFFFYHLPAYKQFGIDGDFWFEKLKPLKFCKTSLLKSDFYVMLVKKSKCKKIKIVCY